MSRLGNVANGVDDILGIGRNDDLLRPIVVSGALNNPRDGSELSSSYGLWTLDMLNFDGKKWILDGFGSKLDDRPRGSSGLRVEGVIG